MKNKFIYDVPQSRVIFGAGSIQYLQREIDLLGAKKALVLCTPEQVELAEKISSILGENSVGVFAKAVMHVPVESAKEARDVAQKLGADCAIAVGGGSTTGLGKAIALEYDLPILAIPTTYAGSEMTPVYGITENGIKKTGKDPRVLPKTVIYDPELTLSLPLEMSITSGINAIAHAAEGLYAQNGNPIMSLLAEEGIRALAEGLKKLKNDSLDIEARSLCLYGAWLCGYVLGNVGMAIHHKLCHTLGGSFNLPHAPTHTVVLPHAIAYNEESAPEAMNRIKRALGANDSTAANALFELIKTLEGPLSLKDLGLTEPDLDKATEIALANPYWNPKPIEKNAIRTLLQNAYEGNPPN
ncbi:maleylacetate reductase [Acinetobacter sp. WU_MDCI_Abxb74]|uniref:maleylacetate reductase n=1 Tax=Acinetobacter sp. WU_MDCI_Abxb74 TaxID=2850072 RepID=UPI0021CD8E66|nr:maleylacetate reductase [Acinetobacter sp. WU_MDCI_Abxb74]MCU4424144.1 maleylacetate reductase [Acinetobacter sp. WU_MDCI_Abxb74]